MGDNLLDLLRGVVEGAYDWREIKMRAGVLCIDDLSDSRTTVDRIRKTYNTHLTPKVESMLERIEVTVIQRIGVSKEGCTKQLRRNLPVLLLVSNPKRAHLWEG